MSTSSPSTPFLSTLRRWWWLPLLGALLGGLLGYSAAGSSTYTATALVRSYVQGFEAQAVAQGAQTALAGLQTPQVFAAAAKQTGTDSKDLRDRTRTTVVGDSAVLSVAVTARTEADAIAQANAVASAGLAQSTARIAKDIQVLRDQAAYILRQGQIVALPRSKDAQTAASLVTYGAAELGRQDSVGRTLGNAQANQITGQGRITLLQAADRATLARDVSKSIAAMSLLGGLLLGLAAALLLGARGARVRSVDKLRRDRPGLTAASVTDLPELLRADEPADRRVLVVAAEGSTLPEQVRELAADRREVLTTVPGSVVAERLSRDPRTLVLVDAPRRSSLAQLDRGTRGATDDTVVVVGS